MIYENTPTILTPRLILRKFAADDAAALFALLRDEQVNTYLPWFPLKTQMEAEAFLQDRFLSHYDKPSAYRYAICLKEEDIPIGYIWLSEGEPYDFGYGLRREYWGREIVTEGALAVVQRIKSAGYPYITATHDENNPQSGRVMQKLGMDYRYSYVEQWQPKDFAVAFCMYQLNFDGDNARTYMGYCNQHTIKQKGKQDE